jgi:hypothetical protein
MFVFHSWVSSALQNCHFFFNPFYDFKSAENILRPLSTNNFLGMCNGDFQTQRYFLAFGVFIWLKKGRNELETTFVHTCRTLQFDKILRIYEVTEQLLASEEGPRSTEFVSLFPVVNEPN